MDDFESVLEKAKKYMDLRLERELEIILKEVDEFTENIGSEYFDTGLKYENKLFLYQSKFIEKGTPIFTNAFKNFNLTKTNPKFTQYHTKISRHLDEWSDIAYKKFSDRLKIYISNDVLKSSNMPRHNFTLQKNQEDILPEILSFIETSGASYRTNATKDGTSISIYFETNEEKDWVKNELVKEFHFLSNK